MLFVLIYILFCFIKYDSVCLSIVSKFLKYGSVKVRYKGHDFDALLADSPLKQAIGLMYRNKIGDNEGMLFIFGRPSYYGIWMHNMRFPIDIIWIDEKKRVAHIVEGAEPCKSILNCKVYKPAKPASAVLEVNAGTAKRLGIKLGGTLEF